MYILSKGLKSNGTLGKDEDVVEELFEEEPDTSRRKDKEKAIGKGINGFRRKWRRI